MRGNFERTERFVVFIGVVTSRAKANLSRGVAVTMSGHPPVILLALALVAAVVGQAQAQVFCIRACPCLTSVSRVGREQRLSVTYLHT